VGITAVMTVGNDVTFQRRLSPPLPPGTFLTATATGSPGPATVEQGAVWEKGFHPALADDRAWMETTVG
jgi:hypothetical protein